MPARIPCHPHPGRCRAIEAYRRSDDRLAANRFYASTRWRRLRASMLRAHPACLDCAAAGRVTLATEVHHVLERAEHPGIAMDPSNLRCLCKPCHGAQRNGSAPRPGA